MINRLGVRFLPVAFLAVLPALGGTITQLASPSTLADDLLPWETLGGDLQGYTPPVTHFTVKGRTVIVSGASSLTTFLGSTYNGDFLPAQTVLAAYDINAGTALTGPIRLDFATPIRGAGAQVQVNSFNIPFTATLTAFGLGNTNFGTVSLVGTVLGNGDGSAPFLGLVSSTVDIVALEFNAGTDVGIAIDSLDIADTPEPSTYVLFGAGLIALALLRRRG